MIVTYRMECIVESYGAPTRRSGRSPPQRGSTGQALRASEWRMIDLIGRVENNADY